MGRNSKSFQFRTHSEVCNFSNWHSAEACFRCSPRGWHRACIEVEGMHCDSIEMCTTESIISEAFTSPDVLFE